MLWRGWTFFLKPGPLGSSTTSRANQGFSHALTPAPHIWPRLFKMVPSCKMQFQCTSPLQNVFQDYTNLLSKAFMSPSPLSLSLNLQVCSFWAQSVAYLYSLEPTCTVWSLLEQSGAYLHWAWNHNQEDLVLTFVTMHQEYLQLSLQQHIIYTYIYIYIYTQSTYTK